MRIEVISMPYIGELSVNHRLGRRRGGGYYLKQEVRDWNEEFGWLLKKLHIEEWELPITVKCDGVFKNQRSAPDLSNLSKVILDEIEEVSGVNDSNFRWVDGSRLIDRRDDPHLLITLSEPPGALRAKSEGFKG